MAKWEKSRSNRSEISTPLEHRQSTCNKEQRRGLNTGYTTVHLQSYNFAGEGPVRLCSYMVQAMSIDTKWSASELRSCVYKEGVGQSHSSGAWVQRKIQLNFYMCNLPVWQGFSDSKLKLHLRIFICTELIPGVYHILCQALARGTQILAGSVIERKEWPH